MLIPRAWARLSGEAALPDGKIVSVGVWGWGDSEPQARRNGADRLERLLDRIRRGGGFPDQYTYGSRPIREEILQTIEGPVRNEPLGVVTRNRYGAQVLSTARLLFLDIDVRPVGLIQRIRQVFGAPRPEHLALASLREALLGYGQATFRVYGTAAGLRAVAVDREFDPAGHEARDLMRATGTDPAFARLCVAQRSFRARLTPKPWRCRRPLPPAEYPCPDAESQRRLDAWLRSYETASTRFATCRYLETIGGGRPAEFAGKLLDVHDRATRCTEPLPLA